MTRATARSGARLDRRRLLQFAGGSAALAGLADAAGVAAAPGVPWTVAWPWASIMMLVVTPALRHWASQLATLAASKLGWPLPPRRALRSLASALPRRQVLFLGH